MHLRSGKLVPVAITATLLMGTTLTSVGAASTPVGPREQVFNATGAMQHYVVPQGICEVSIDAFGAQGGEGSLMHSVGIGVGGPHGFIVLPQPGGKGARASSIISVTPGETLDVAVGGKGDPGTSIDLGSEGSTLDPGTPGWNGGGAGGTTDNGVNVGGGGGGSSDVRQGGSGLANRVVVAGGGGGSGSGALDTLGGDGGVLGSNGGDGSQQSLPFTVDDPNGPSPMTYGTGAQGGRGASTNAGGAGGSGGVIDESQGSSGGAGLLGQGGRGANSPFAGNMDIGGYSGGGGGGGLFGGGGGGSAAAFPNDFALPQLTHAWVSGGAGGGGSSLGDRVETGVHDGNGQVVIAAVLPCGDLPPIPTSSTLPKSVSQPASAVREKPTFTG